MGLRDPYAYALQTAKGKFDGSAQEKDGKLHFVGSVKSEAEANEIWNAIKTIPTWRNDVIADIKVVPGAAGFRSKASSRRVVPTKRKVSISASICRTTIRACARAGRCTERTSGRAKCRSFVPPSGRSCTRRRPRPMR